jgi:hypothetical protein
MNLCEKFMNSSMKWCLFELDVVLLYLVWLYMIKVDSFMHLQALIGDFCVVLYQTREQSTHFCAHLACRGVWMCHRERFCSCCSSCPDECTPDERFSRPTVLSPTLAWISSFCWLSLRPALAGARRARLSDQIYVLLWLKWCICLYYDCIMIIWWLNGLYDYKLGLEWWIKLWCYLYDLSMMIMYVEMRL